MSTSGRTSLTSILKPFSATDRERALTAALNKVRFSTPKSKGLLESVRVALEDGDSRLVQEFTYYISKADICDEEFINIMRDARTILHDLITNVFAKMVEALLSIPWKKRSLPAIEAYSIFCIDIMVAHNGYIQIGLPKLIVHWIPSDEELAEWNLGCPSESLSSDLERVHQMLDRILRAVPMAFNHAICIIAERFPYFKKPVHIIAGYLHNIFWLMEYSSIFEEALLKLVLQKLLTLDVNAPRNEIAELDEETDDEDQMDETGIFTMEDVPAEHPKSVQYVKHTIGHTLDVCLMNFYKFLDGKCRTTPDCSQEERCRKYKFFRTLLDIFDDVLLPTHNIHHVQFYIFYACSIRSVYASEFLKRLWDKVQDPKIPLVIRHSCTGYLSSFLARANFIPLSTLTFYLKELCDWAHKYIDDTDCFSPNGSLKANMIFYSVAQAVFYLIAFRARDLTANRQGLLFLQSLQLSRLAMCHLNPLRYCLPPVATAFAGVTRTHQLAYCHTVLERNARRKLATVYGHDKAKAEETLETFFPFDPYLLKMSNAYIDSKYLVYTVQEIEESTECINTQMQRKRGDSEMLEEDDFIQNDKRPKWSELSKSLEFDKNYHYGHSPGFNTNI